LRLNDRGFPSSGRKGGLTRWGHGVDGAQILFKLSTLTTLTLDNNYIRSLEGVERLPNLSSLSARKNYIHTLTAPLVRVRPVNLLEQLVPRAVQRAWHPGKCVPSCKVRAILCKDARV